mgnify:CR=1 FL=1
MKILYIIPWIPYPLNSGGNQAFYNMVNAVRKEYQVSLLLSPHTSGDRNNVSELKKIWRDVDIDCYDKRHSNLSNEICLSKSDQRKSKFYTYIEKSMKRKQKRLFRDAYQHIDKNSISKEQFLGMFVQGHADLYEYIEDFDNSFLEYIYTKTRQGYDIVQIEFYEYLPLVYVLPDDVKKVFVHHELRFVRNQNEISLFDEVKPIDYFRFERQKDAEIAALQRFDNILVASDVDRNILSKYLPEQKIYVSPFAVSVTGSDQSLSFKAAKDLVFVGSGGHFPNADGILWFSMYVVPLLISRGFAGNIFVTGNWGSNIKDLINQYCSNVEFIGFVDDIHEFLNGKITIVPIRIGSGMRMKIMDAIPSYSPIVTTSKGCEGIPLQDEKDCFIKDSPEDFAEVILKLLNDANLQNSIASSAIESAKGMMDTESLLKRRLDFYKLC